MKLENKYVDPKTNIDLSTGLKFGIAPGQELHVIQILRDKLYSNKPLAVIRELATNAWDQHIEAGIPDTPIEVHLPTQTESFYSVRDFGNGLSPQQIDNTFRMYGASTKRESDEQAGTFGLGCKAPFCMVQSFIIETILEGIKYTYLSFIEKTGMGQINLLGSKQSTEQSGTKIIVNLPISVVSGFTNEATRFFLDSDGLTNLELDRPEILLSGKVEDISWQIEDSIANWRANDSIILMGHVPYETKDSSYFKLKITVPIGSINIVASREALERTEKTKKYLQYIDSILPNSIQKEKEKLISSLSGIEKLQFIQKIERMGVSKESINYYAKRVTPSSCSKINYPITWNTNHLYFSEDPNQPNLKWIQLIRQELNRTGKQTAYFLSHSRANEIQSQFGVTISLVSSLRLEKIVYKKKTNKNIIGTYFQFNYIYEQQLHSKNWKSSNLPEKYYWIDILRFIPVKNEFRIETNIDLHNKVNHWRELNLIEDIPLIGIKKRNNDPSNNLFEVVKKNLEKTVTEKIINCLNYSQEYFYHSDINKIYPPIQQLLKHISEESPLNRIFFEHTSEIRLNDREKQILHYLSIFKNTEKEFFCDRIRERYGNMNFLLEFDGNWKKIEDAPLLDKIILWTIQQSDNCTLKEKLDETTLLSSFVQSV